MANVLITNECNLRCPYCFADGVTCFEPEFMTADQLRKIVEMASHTKETIKILGGEPTIHPDFIKLYKIIEEYNSNTTSIFSNGILLHKYYKELTVNQKADVLINVNDLSDKSQEIQDNFDRSLKMFADDSFSYGTLGCNLYLGEQEYNYFFDVVKRYDYLQKLEKTIRVSVTAPASQYKEFSESRKKEYYEAMRPIYINFLQKCKEHGLNVILDCNQIPPCFLTYEETELIKQIGCLGYLSCNSCPIDIDCHFNVWPCFGRKEETINIADSMDTINFNQLRKQFDANRKGSKDCVLNKSAICSFCTGGCASFKEGATI